MGSPVPVSLPQPTQESISIWFHKYQAGFVATWEKKKEKKEHMHLQLLLSPDSSRRRPGVLIVRVIKTNGSTNGGAATQWQRSQKKNILPDVLLARSQLPGSLWDHLVRISMTGFLRKGSRWIVMRRCRAAETFMVCFAPRLRSRAAPSPPARRIGVDALLAMHYKYQYSRLQLFPLHYQL